MLKKLFIFLSTLVIVAILSLLVALYLAPGVALSYASDWYAEQGEGYLLEVKSWRFAPFSTHLSLQGVTLTHPKVGQESTHLDQLVIDVNLWALFKHTIEVRNLILDGVELSLDALLSDTQESISIAGLSIPLSAEQAEEKTQEQAKEVESDDKLANEKTQQEQIEDETKQEEAEETPEELLAWTVQIHNLEIKNQTYQWHIKLDELTTQGKAHISKIQLAGLDTSVNSHPQINVSIELQELSVSGAQNLQLKSPLTVDLKGRFKNVKTQPQWEGELSLNNFSMVLEENLTVGFAQLNLTNILADVSAQTIEKLLIQNISLVDSKGLTLNIDDLSINELSSSNKQSFALMQLNNIVMNDEPMSLTVEQVSLESFNHQDLKPQLDSLLVKQVVLTSQEQPLLSLQHYGLANLAADFNEEEFTVTLGKQNYSGLLVNIQRNQQGQLVGLSSADTPAAESAEQTAQATATPTDEGTDKQEEKPLLLALVLAGLIQQAEEVDSDNPVVNKIHIEDYSIKPRLKTDINIEKINIGEVSSSLKQSDFSLTNAIPFEINLGIGRYNKSTIEGELSVFERDGQLYPQGAVKVSVRQLDLVPFNGYIIKSLGYQLDRGSLDVDAHITFDKAQLGGEVRLLLRNSKFTPKDEATIKKISKQISMPLDMAVGLLRDDHGNLRLNIPVSGDMSDPDFDLDDITKQLSQRALKAGTVYFLKQAMQPYGLMLSVATLAGDYLFAIRLEALNYVRGVSELVDDQVESLTKIAQIMVKKKDIEVKVCPFVSEEEMLELGDEWAELANARGQKVKDWLVKYDPSLSQRISICRPQQGKKSEVVIGVN